MNDEEKMLMLQKDVNTAMKTMTDKMNVVIEEGPSPHHLCALKLICDNLVKSDKDAQKLFVMYEKLDQVNYFRLIKDE